MRTKFTEDDLFCIKYTLQVNEALKFLIIVEIILHLKYKKNCIIIDN